MQDVVEALQRIEKLVPFPIRGIDSDNGSEFINDMLLKYCLDREDKIMFTRSRPYHKNDQAHVEQKNWAVVRRILGYHRFDTDEHFDLISQVYALNHIYNNFFQPIKKMIGSPKIDETISCPKYDLARTPYRRALESQYISLSQKAALMPVYLSKTLSH